MLDHFIAYLRATLGASRTTAHPLADEFELLRDYLELMAVRMGAPNPPVAFTLKKDGVKSVGYIGFSDAWGDLVYNALMKAAPAAGIQVLGNERYARADASQHPGAAGPSPSRRKGMRRSHARRARRERFGGAGRG